VTVNSLSEWRPVFPRTQDDQTQKGKESSPEETLQMKSKGKYKGGEPAYTLKKTRTGSIVQMKGKEGIVEKSTGSLTGLYELEVDHSPKSYRIKMIVCKGSDNCKKE